MITKPEPMFTPADVMGPRTTPLVPVVVTIFTRETPAEPPLACGTTAGDKCK